MIGSISIPLRAKEIIDRRDPGDDDESKEDPTPPHVYQPSERDFVTNYRHISKSAGKSVLV